MRSAAVGHQSRRAVTTQDAVASRTPSDVRVGRQRLAHAGAHLGDRLRRRLADGDRGRARSGARSRRRRRAVPMPTPIVSFRDSKSISASPASARIPRTRSASANANGPGASGGGGVGGGTCCNAAKSGTVIQGFSGSDFQQWKPRRPPGASARARLANAARGSWKNITPKREKITSKLAGAKACVCASAARKTARCVLAAPALARPCEHHSARCRRRGPSRRRRRAARARATSRRSRTRRRGRARPRRAQDGPSPACPKARAARRASSCSVTHSGRPARSST